MIKPFRDALDAGQIEPVFLADGQPLQIDGLVFYQATNAGVDMGIARYYALGDCFRRHEELKLSDEVLQAGVSSTTAFLKRILAQASLDPNQVIDAAHEALKVQERLAERMELGLSVQLVYEVAGIWFFCEDEDPYQVDSDKRRRNSRTLMQRPELFNFFLSLPLNRFVPLHGLFQPNTLNSLTDQNARFMVDWSITLLKLKSHGVSSETITTTESLKETLFALDGLYGSLSNNTTTM